jgi:hypothetical protein
MLAATVTATMDFLQLKAEYDAYATVVSTYDGLKTTYESLRTIYNKALTD